MSRVAEPTGLLIVRVWREAAEARSVRARITHVLEVSGSARMVTTAGSVDSIEAIVHRWLEEFLASTDEDRDRDPDTK